METLNSSLESQESKPKKKRPYKKSVQKKKGMRKGQWRRIGGKMVRAAAVKEHHGKPHSQIEFPSVYHEASFHGSMTSEMKHKFEHETKRDLIIEILGGLRTSDAFKVLDAARQALTSKSIVMSN